MSINLSALLSSCKESFALPAMSPIVVSHNASGRLVAVAGASGGPLIVSATLQTLARWVEYRAGMQACMGSCSAVQCLMPRWHVSLAPPITCY
jgi:gamma-glutamyltranspeptidase